MKDIRLSELAAKGLSDEEILAEVKKVLAERKSDLQKKEKIEKAEKDLATATANYVMAVTGRVLSDAEIEELSEVVSNITNDVKRYYARPKAVSIDDILDMWKKSL